MTKEVLTQEQLEMMKRVELVKQIVIRLIQLPASQGIGIALGILIEVSRYHKVPFGTLVDILRKTWDEDDEP